MPSSIDLRKSVGSSLFRSHTRGWHCVGGGLEPSGPGRPEVAPAMDGCGATVGAWVLGLLGAFLGIRRPRAVVAQGARENPLPSKHLSRRQKRAYATLRLAQ